MFKPTVALVFMAAAGVLFLWSLASGNNFLAMVNLSLFVVNAGLFVLNNEVK